MLVSALVAGFVSSGTPAYAAPEEVLQSVEVDLGADGSIGSVTSTSVHQVGEDARRESQGFDPAEAAGELPVRVQTSYRLGDRAGTDLTEIEGESGRVVIDVTVQNTTATAQELTYDSNGVQRSEYALVGTPLTVVASADLGEDSIDRVVTTDDVAPDTVTNGVLSRGDDAAARVQWATMLAPPRLGASTTFRLVLDAEDFSVPRFDVSVQPGLVADTSVRRLLEAAFSDDAGSTVSLESRTLELIGDVNAVLAEAGGVLGEIEAELGATADTLGARTIADLQSSSTQVTTSMSTLAADLDGLSSEMGQQLRDGNDSALAALRGTVDDVKALLGDPARTRPASVPAVGGCRTPIADADSSATIFQQLVAVSGQLDAFAGATAACRDQIQNALVRTVGDLNATEEDCRDSDAAICVLRATRAELRSEAVELEAFGADFAGKFDVALLGQVDKELSRLVSRIEDLDRMTNGLSGGGTGPIDNDLLDIEAALELLLGELDPAPEAESGAAAVLARLSAQVTTIETALGDSGTGAEQVAAWAQADGVADQVCSVARGGGLSEADQQLLDKVSLLTTGERCGQGVAEYVFVEGERLPASMQDRFATVQSTLVEFGTLESDLRSTFLAARTKVGEAIDLVNDAQDEEAPTLKQKIQQLVCAVGSLSNADLTNPCTPLEDDAPLPALVQANEELQKKQGNLTDEEILAQFGLADGILDDADAGLQKNEGAVDRARQRAAASIDTLVEDLGGDLGTAARTVLADGRRVVNTQRGALDNEVTRVGGELENGVTGAVQAIEGDVAASNVNLRASERLLLADLRRVLVDLGDRSNNGTGLLGALVSGATRTGVADRQITAASRTADAFGSVRARDLEDLFLQQAQLNRGLELQQEFPVFGLDLPAGSSHVTVFSFRLEGA